MEAKRILVTGASGYIAGRLIPRLLADGYRVRCLTRNPKKLFSRPWYGQVEVATGDVTHPESLPAALEGIDSAYYLIHNMSSGRHYRQAELEGARNFARAAHEAGVAHIIYLGGLADPNENIGPHMRSRIETGEALREFPVPVTEFRAGVIAGPGSISFEMIRFICEQFPVILGPTWMKNRSQPISAGNVLDYLIAALETPACRGMVLEIGGQETYLYHELMHIYAQIRGTRRRTLLIPGIPTSLMAYFVDKLTPVPAAIAHPLINGLQSDSVVKDTSAQEVFPHIQLDSFHEAVQESLAQLHPDTLDRIWISGSQDRSLKHEGFLVKSRHLNPAPSMEQLLQFAGTDPGGYHLERQDSTRLLLKKEEGKWLEWELLEDGRILRQTAFYAPRDLSGFLKTRRWRAETGRIFHQIRQF
ncbi:MAG: NmrA family NAD(P)-binding protein [Anaerolineales bacterium]